MKWFKKEDKKKSWKDITLRQGIEISELDIEDSWELILNQMAIIKDTTMDVIESQPAALVYEFMNDYNFLDQLPKMKKLDSFKRGGVRYKLIDLSKMTLAQMVDIEEYYNAGLIPNIHKILSVIYLPVEKDYLFRDKLSEYVPDTAREEMFLDMDMETVFGAILFFWTGVKIYSKGLKDYLQEENQKMMKMTKEMDD